MSTKVKKPSSSSRFVFLLLLSFLGSLLYISFYSYNFQFPAVVILLHSSLILAAIFTYLFLGLTIFKLFKQHQYFTKYLLTLLFGFGFFSLISIYLLNYISLTEWGQIISFKIVYLFFYEIPALVEALPYNEFAIYGILFLYPMLTIGFIFLFRNNIYAFFASTYNKINALKRRNKFLIGISILTTLVFLISHIITHKSYFNASFKLRGEPIYNFFKPTSANFGKQSLDLKEVEKNKEARKLFLNYNADFDKKNIILIVVDALRADHLTMYGYDRKTSPFLQELYEKSGRLKVEKALSNCSTSFCGILSILSGRMINKLDISNYKINDFLKDLGYKTHFFLGGAHNEWYQLRRFYEYTHPLDYYFEGPDSENFSISDDRALFDFFDKVPAYNNQPSFLYFHLMTVHKSGTKLEKYNEYEPCGKTSLLAPDREAMTNIYDNSILQADDFIKKIYEKLERKGFLENSIIIFTADHGEAIGERGQYGHSSDLYQPKIHIPFIVFDEKNAVKKTTNFGTQVDIAPTIADLIAVPSPVVWDGRSLLKEDTIRYSTHRQQDVFSIVKYTPTNIYKYIFDTGENKEELYDIKVDILEQKNLIKEKSLTAELKELKQIYRENFK